MAPFLSVIMSVFNGEKYVRETVESVLNQSFRDFEFIIVNDGSTDGTSEILRSFKDERIRIINQENRGLTKSLNRGIGVSEGKYIGRIDCGDIAFEKKFEVQLNFLGENKDICGVGTWANLIDEKGNVIGELKYPTEYEEIKKIILRYNPFVHPSLVFRRELFDEIGPYDESFEYAQDYDLVLRAVSKFKIVNLPEILLNYQVSEEAISFKKLKKQELCALKIRAKALSQYEYPKWQSLYLLKPSLSFLIPAGLKKIVAKKILQRHMS